MNTETTDRFLAEVTRLADALERIAGPQYRESDLDAADCFVWKPEQRYLAPVASPSRVDLSLIRGVDHVRDILFENTLRFAEGFPANNALLWGARGMGKSSLVKAVHAAIIAEHKLPLKLVELYREDIGTLGDLLEIIKASSHRFLLFSDDLSFDHDDAAYKSLKAALDGGVEGRPENVLLYATSNRRHLMPEFMSDNLKSEMRDGELHPAEAIEEQVSLADRFGLQLSFYAFSQAVYLQAVDALFPDFDDREGLHREAIRFATVKGVRNGRTAQQFYRQFAGDRYLGRLK